VNQVLKKLQIVDLTDPIARLAAQLKLRAGMVGVAATIDAVVVAVSAIAGGGVIVTSDVEDVRRLLAPQAFASVPSKSECGVAHARLGNAGRSDHPELLLVGQAGSGPHSSSGRQRSRPRCRSRATKSWGDGS